jgi:zinc D-Ala-D-Ala carboxypeptidase
VSRRLTEKFWLSEFLPKGMEDSEVPPEVVANIEALAATLLQPVRSFFNTRVNITSGYRPPARNAAVGGVRGSDHERGAAADFWLTGTTADSWEELTIEAFNWLRVNKAGEFGQLILEDHRAFFGDPGKLWVHVALRSAKHGGTALDRNRLLVSYAPRKYRRWREAELA